MHVGFGNSIAWSPQEVVILQAPPDDTHDPPDDRSSREAVKTLQAPPDDRSPREMARMLQDLVTWNLSHQLQLESATAHQPAFIQYQGSAIHRSAERPAKDPK